MDDRLVALVEPYVASRGLDLEDAQFSKAGSQRILRVSVDADGGVGIETITGLSRELSSAFDTDPAAESVLGSAPYTLEVTSRGVDSPLVHPRHWRRNLGRLVNVELTDGARIRGRIADVDDDKVTVTVDATPRVFAHTDIVRALVQVELNRKDV